MEIRYPVYFDEFACIAGACPDSCCKEWEVAIDADTAQRYIQWPGRLGEDLRRQMYQEDGAWYFRNVDGRCPMWRADGLCRIQAGHGHDALSHTCREFPRLTHDFGDFQEWGLELSCPEAARLILASTGAWTTKHLPDGPEGDYDGEAMDSLLSTRETARALLQGSEPVNEALAKLLIFGYHAQSQLDGAEAVDFDEEKALDDARNFARNGDLPGLLAFFGELEMLSEDWAARLAAPDPAPWQEAHRRIARYFVERYWLQAVADYDLVSRVKLAVVSTLVIRTLGGDLLQTAQRYSKEIENSADNVDAILDGAYAHPALTDEKLLHLLLVGG